jgi:hypothetical protein
MCIYGITIKYKSGTISFFRPAKRIKKDSVGRTRRPKCQLIFFIKSIDPIIPTSLEIIMKIR